VTSQLRILRFPNGSAVLERRAHARAPWAGWEGDSIIARGSVEACRAAARGIGVLVRDDDAANYHDGVDEYPEPGSYVALAEAACAECPEPQSDRWRGLLWRANAWLLMDLARKLDARPVPPHTASDF